jgi:ABC-2 type transport system ATP-binding protein
VIELTSDAVDVGVVADLRGVHKRYGKVEALRGVDLEDRPGELVALPGPNGAGKTTAVSVLLGQRRPDAGSARLFGHDPSQPAARRSVGVTPQESGFPDNLTVAEVADLVRVHYPNPVATPEPLGRFGLAQVACRLSGGQWHRLAVALAFAGRPRLAVLDEPTSGLDVEARHRLWEVPRAFVAEGGSVLLTPTTWRRRRPWPPAWWCSPTAGSSPKAAWTRSPPAPACGWSGPAWRRRSCG